MLRIVDWRRFFRCAERPLDENAEEKLNWLRGKAADIREEVGRRIVLKYLPKFEYILDHSAARGARIFQVMDEIEHPPGKDPSEDNT